MAHGAFVHIELPVTDMVGAERFYSTVFGWKVTAKHTDDYWLFAAPAGPGGAFMKAASIVCAPVDMEKGAMAYTNYIHVNSVDETTKAIEAAGGKAVTEKMEVPKTGWFLCFEDPFGNVMAIWEDNPESGMES